MENNLKQAMKENGVTQKDLAEIMGLSQQRISQFVRGTHVPSLIQALQISSLLGFTVEEIWRE